MTRDDAKGRRLTGLFLLGCALFNYPLLSLFNHERMVLGIPLLHLYIFGVWAALIFLAAVVTSAPPVKKRRGPPPPSAGR